jgi:hypothetical protein
MTDSNCLHIQYPSSLSAKQVGIKNIEVEKILRLKYSLVHDSFSVLTVTVRST